MVRVERRQIGRLLDTVDVGLFLLPAPAGERVGFATDTVGS
jgi:hypothetical protein